MVPLALLGAAGRGIAAGLMCLAVTLAGSEWLLSQERARVLGQEGAKLQVLAGAMADKLEGGLNRWLADTTAMAGHPGLRAALTMTPGTIAAARRQLEEIQRRSPEYAWIGIVELDGRVAAATEGLLEGANISHRPIFRGGVEGPFLGDIHPSVMLDRLLRERRPSLGTAPIEFVDVAVPIESGPDTPGGVVTVHVDWGWAAQERQRLLANQARPGSSILVLDTAGKVVLDEGPLNNSTVGADVLHPKSDRAWTEDPEWLSAAARTGAIGRHRGQGWSVVAREEIGALLEPLRALQLRLYALSALASLIAGILMRRLVTGRPLRDLSLHIDTPDPERR